MATAKNTYVRIELSEAVIARLLARGEVCAADFRCLDCHAKNCLWRLALKSCRSTPPSKSNDGLCRRCGHHRR